MKKEFIQNEQYQDLDPATLTMFGFMLGSNRCDLNGIRSMNIFLTQPLDKQLIILNSLSEEIVDHASRMTTHDIASNSIDYIYKLATQSLESADTLRKNNALVLFSDIYQTDPEVNHKVVTYTVNFVTEFYNPEIQKLKGNVKKAIDNLKSKTIYQPHFFYYSLDILNNHAKALTGSDLVYVRAYSDKIISDARLLASISNGSFENDSDSVMCAMDEMFNQMLSDVPFMRAITYHNLKDLQNLIKSETIRINLHLALNSLKQLN
jgi:hypothetical protein